MQKLFNNRGQGLIEYALILVFITLVVIVVLGIFGPSLGSVFSQITSKLGTM